MRILTPGSRLARGAAAVTLAAAAAGVGLLAVATPAASASANASAATAGGVGYIRLAHLSPNTPAVDVYLYSFGNSSAKIVLHHVAYGTVSPFEQVAAGDYTVAMRAAGARPKSKPVLSTAVDVKAGKSYTVAGVGPESGLRLQVIPDKMTTPRGKALVRVIQASMAQDVVTVTAAGRPLATNLKFASVTTYKAVRPGTWVVRVAGSSEHAHASIQLAAGSLHTLVILDAHGGLAVDDLMDAQGSSVVPGGAPQTGFGGTAARPGLPLLPWAAAASAGLLAAAGGALWLTRRRRPALHAR